MLQRITRPSEGSCRLGDQHFKPRLLLKDKMMASAEACKTLASTTLHMSSQRPFVCLAGHKRD